MYNKKDLVRILNRNLKRELKAINFYISNISKLGYDKNRSKIDKLALESFDHSKRIAAELIKLKGNGKPATKKAKADSINEELALQDIYQYELERTDDPSIKKLLKRLIKEEKQHEKLARHLK